MCVWIDASVRACVRACMCVCVCVCVCFTPSTSSAHPWWRGWRPWGSSKQTPGQSWARAGRKWHHHFILRRLTRRRKHYNLVFSWECVTLVCHTHTHTHRPCEASQVFTLSVWSWLASNWFWNMAFVSFGKKLSKKCFCFGERLWMGSQVFIHL